MKELSVIVIGGGIAGLAAAYEVSRRGVRPLVLEAAERPGGVIRTDIQDDLLIDAGPDSFLVQKPAAITLCRELGLLDRIICSKTPRTAYVLKHGRLEPLPEPSFFGFPANNRALADTNLLSPEGKKRAIEDLTTPAPDPAAPDESVGAFVRRRFGQEAVDWIAEPLLAGIHAGDVERLSVDALFPALREAERHHGSVLRAAADHAQHVGASSDGAFRSLIGGMGELIAALERTLGDTIHVHSRAVRIERDACQPTLDERRRGGYRVVLDSGDSATASSVIIATPAHVTRDLVAPFDPFLAARCDEIRYESSATVVLSYARHQIDRAMMGSGFVVPRRERGVAILAATWITSKWPHRAGGDRALLRAFLGGARDPHRLDSPDEALTDVAHRDLAAIMGIAGPPSSARVYRWIRANPQHEVGHLARVASIDARLRDWPGLGLTGSGFRAVGIPDVIADARATAGAVLDSGVASRAEGSTTQGRDAVSAQEPRVPKPKA